MRVVSTGDGPPVMLVHGGGVAGWMWRPLLDAVAGDGAGASPRIRAIVPDLPGHGASADRDYVSHDATVAELVALLEAEAPHGAVVVGFSLGAQLALRLASDHPHLVRGAVIVSAEVLPAPLPRATLALLRWTAPLARWGWFARLQARQLAIPDRLLPEYLAGSRAMTSATLLASVRDNIAFTLPNAWADYPGPVAVLVGQRERRLMRDSAREIREVRPASELHIVPGAGHDLPFTAPDVLAARIRAVIEAAPGAALAPVLPAAHDDFTRERPPGADEDVHMLADVVDHVLERLSSPGDTVLDPFAGFGTTLERAIRLGRHAIGVELLPERVAHIRRHVPSAAVIEGDARELRRIVRTELGVADGGIDLVLTSPPYMTITDHAADPLTAYERDGGDYRRYLAELGLVAEQCARLVAPGGHVVWNVADIHHAGRTTPLIEDYRAVLARHLEPAGVTRIAWDRHPHDLVADALLVFRRPPAGSASAG